MAIKNGRNSKLNTINGNLPYMANAMQGWTRPITFVVINKVVVNNRVVESRVEKKFKGTWQPLSASQVSQKPEGMRSWRWYSVHSETSLSLENDDVINYLGKDYRIKANSDYSEFGYFEYQLIEDYV